MAQKLSDERFLTLLCLLDFIDRQNPTFGDILRWSGYSYQDGLDLVRDLEHSGVGLHTVKHVDTGNLALTLSHVGSTFRGCAVYRHRSMKLKGMK